MLIRPHADDFAVIGYYLGRVFLVVAAAGLAPTLWSALAREWAPFGSFVVMSGTYALVGILLLGPGIRQRRLDWSHGMVVVALTWMLVPAIGSIPFLLSGHFAHPLDAYFDAMSGLSTTGLALVNDLDHLASSLNFWRHLLHFLGGQGIVIAALSILVGGGAVTLYLGEGRDDRIFPSVTSTARFIWSVALVHLAVGVTVLGLVAWIRLGYDPLRAAFHALMIFFGAFDTGGFAPQSTSMGYYHDWLFEAVTAVLMVAGAVSFGVHFALWKGRRRAVLANLETKTILTTFGLTLGLTIVGLAVAGVYGSVAGLTRQGLFQVLSAHTGTGFATVTNAELAGWGGLAFGGMAIAMALGGMASSTAGGVKALRIGLTVKAVTLQVKQTLLPEGAVISRAYDQGGKRRLTPEMAQAAMVASLLYVALYLLGAGVALAYGVPLQPALFESVSAGANVGLSVGVTDTGMPVLLQITYMVQMWLGRLEFVAAFALLGFLYSWWRGK